MISSRRPDAGLLKALALSSALVAGGCASDGRRLAETEALSSATPKVELDDTPFFPQDALQCGPAALATVLSASGLPVTPDVLEPEVFTPGLSGSLQPELLGAIRRRGMLAYEIRPDLESLSSELLAGRPVLVLQNLGFAIRPVWHYAVVIGADRPRERLILRSGTRHRLEMSTRRFVRSWDRADRWAFVVLRPGEMPALPDVERYRRAALGLEAAAQYRPAARAWQAALAVWPDDPVALFGLGNARYALGDLSGARSAWERFVSDNPGDRAGLNNLAVVLGEIGCPERGLRLARRALSGLPPGDAMAAELLDTIGRLDATHANADPVSCEPPPQ